MSKTVVTVLVLAGAGIGALYLYKRGKAQQDQLGQSGSVATTVRTGMASLIASVKASSPASHEPISDKDNADVATPTEAGADPRISQRIPSTRRWDGFLGLKAVAKPMTQRDLISQGIAR